MMLPSEPEARCPDHAAARRSGHDGERNFLLQDIFPLDKIPIMPYIFFYPVS
jgi:hypothetical protein